MKSQLEDLTFVEFRERLKDNPVILIPLGSQEEQGASAPMGDFMLAKALARRVAEKTGAIAAPTVPFGYADYFRPVPGGIQLTADTFKRLLRDVLDNFLAHGLTRLLIFNGHTGNGPLIDQVVRTVKRETGIVIPWINIWRVIPEHVWREAHAANAPRARGHGVVGLSAPVSRSVSRGPRRGCRERRRTDRAQNGEPARTPVRGPGGQCARGHHRPFDKRHRCR
jgi:creatinine amidohydrolase